MTELLKVNEAVDAILRRELSETIPMLVDPTLKVVGDADVKATRLAREDVDVVRAHRSAYDASR
jgi:hypothetical protein